MKKTLAIAAMIAVVSGIGMIAFSENKRPNEMNKSEKIQKNIKEAKEDAKKKAEEELLEQASQAQTSN